MLILIGLGPGFAISCSWKTMTWSHVGDTSGKDGKSQATTVRPFRSSISDLSLLEACGLKGCRTNFRDMADPPLKRNGRVYGLDMYRHKRGQTQGG
jgi:hypothetical protein